MGSKRGDDWYATPDAMRSRIRVYLTLAQETIDRLAAYADAAGESRSAVVEQALAEFLPRRRGKK